MKNKLKIVLVIMLFALFTSVSSISFAQPPPPPPVGGHGLGSNSPPGAGAPIGEGLYLLIGLAGIYGAKKAFNHNKPIKKIINDSCFN